ncbi:MAG: sporulation protein YqfD [Clostridia bacterium]|nr:sporulation protein YqfD [Clostridia bacterium]
MNLTYLLVGSVTVQATYGMVAALLNLCMYYCIPYTDFVTVEEGVRLTFRSGAFRRLKHEAALRGIDFAVVKRRGLPALLERYRHRYGIAVGALIAVAMIFLSSRLVWDVRVTGNERITSSEVRALLYEYGFGVGSYIPSVNTDRLENRILMDSEQISWISVNIIGTVAEVQIREIDGEKTADDEAVKKPANLIASKAGVVEEVRIFQGRVMVGSGTYVEKGDLLVSGLYDSEQVGFRYTRASGKVLARTASEFFIEIPYEYEGIRYLEEEYYDKYLNFFDFSINISKNSGKEGVLYDKIDIVENCSLPGGLQTPIEIRTVRYLAYEQVKMTRSAAEAEELAYFELSRRLGEMAEDRVIIRKTVTPRVGEDSFSLYCVVVCIEDIAAVSEFEVDMSIVGD